MICNHALSFDSWRLCDLAEISRSWQRFYTFQSIILNYCNRSDRGCDSEIRLRALTICMKISEKTFREMVLVIFFAFKTGMVLSCAIYKIPVNFSHSLERKRGTGNPHKWYRKFRPFWLKRDKGYMTRKVLPFFRKHSTGINCSIWILSRINGFFIQIASSAPDNKTHFEPRLYLIHCVLWSLAAKHEEGTCNSLHPWQQHFQQPVIRGHPKRYLGWDFWNTHGALIPHLCTMKASLVKSANVDLSPYKRLWSCPHAVAL